VGRIVQRMLTIVDMPEIRVRKTEKQDHNRRNAQIADAGGKADSYCRELGFARNRRQQPKQAARRDRNRLLK